MPQISDAESWFRRRHLTLDIAGLTEEKRAHGSTLLGGSAAEFITPEQAFNLDEVSTVVFNWGDPRAEQVFAALLEHDDRPGPGYYPFSPSTVIGDMIWSLVIQERAFDPEIAYPSTHYYFVLPYDAETGVAKLHEYLSIPTPRPELLAKIWTRWVAFELGTDIT